METVYEDEEVAIMKWMAVPNDGHQYLIESKNEQYKRQGKGFLLISPAGLQQMCRALGEIVW